MKSFIVLSMIFCHILDDYKIQAGVLNNLKTKSWWKKNYPDSMYKHDYIVGLVMHSLSWSFMILLPVAVYYEFNIDFRFIVIFFINATLHAIIDDLKANQHLINLVVDQTAHMIQIAVTATVLLFK